MSPPALAGGMATDADTRVCLRLGRKQAKALRMCEGLLR
ncbi:hypothetical protein HMPREF9413_5571 [Paenibacillus sp. HGF7]|nr:hypothetical protein HMPREF9413_5571 [Paenibacillus sp. HGF7]